MGRQCNDSKRGHSERDPSRVAFLKFHVWRNDIFYKFYSLFVFCNFYCFSAQMIIHIFCDLRSRKTRFRVSHLTYTFEYLLFRLCKTVFESYKTKGSPSIFRYFTTNWIFKKPKESSPFLQISALGDFSKWFFSVWKLFFHWSALYPNFVFF